MNLGNGKMRSCALKRPSLGKRRRECLEGRLADERFAEDLRGAMTLVGVACQLRPRVSAIIASARSTKAVMTLG
jgi:hypothetical protein